MVRLSFVVVFFLALWASSPTAQAINPKLKVMLTTSAYGTAGGALLGTATLAFGAEGRAIAQGASIGLYAGMIFGGYILYSYHQKRSTGRGDGEYPPVPSSPYQNGYDGPGGYDSYETDDYRWRVPRTFFDGSLGARGGARGGATERAGKFSAFKSQKIPFYLQLIRWQF